MLGITDLKTGTTLVYEGEPHIVLSYEHSKQGRGGAVMRTKLRNVKSGASFDVTFKGSDKFDEAYLDKRPCSFLYAEGNDFTFMDSASFEQFSIMRDALGSKVNFLKEGTELQVMFYDDQPVSVELPIKMEFEVTEAQPGVKGDTAQGGSKPATLETGAVITVPLFVKQGDIVRVNTVEGTYVERAR
jgi:elongation factor P